MVKMSENATAQTLADVYPGVSSDKQKRNLKDGTGEEDNGAARNIITQTLEAEQYQKILHTRLLHS